jgi:hypothetical protein
MSGAAGAASGSICERLFIPDGYQLTCTLEGSSESGRWIARVRPSDGGAFDDLTELRLEPVEGPIDEPELWLRERMVVDLSGFETALDDLLDNPDSPFADLVPEGSMREWGDMMRALGQLPLQGCAEPVRLAGGPASPGPDRYEMACFWQLGPLTQYMNVRLVEQDGQPYAIRLRAVNERRLRHLKAIANSFVLK